MPALLAVGAVAWLALEAVRAPASPELVYSSAQPRDNAQQQRLALQGSSLPQNDAASLINDIGPVVVVKPERKIAPTQIVQMAPKPNATPPQEPEPEPMAVAAPTEPKPQVTDRQIVAPQIAKVEPASCVTELRSFARDQIIRFSSGRADLEDRDLPVLRRIGRMAEDCPNTLIQVKGHTDSIGSDVINLALSWQRADNTIATLAALGIDTQNFEPIGFGARAPLAQGDSSDEQFNRRVEFRVLTTEETRP